MTPILMFFSEWFEGAVTPEPAFMVRTATHKLTVYPDPEFMRRNMEEHAYCKFSDLWALPTPQGELYDLGADPREKANLFDNPRAAAVKQKLLARLDKWKKGAVMFDYGSVIPQPVKGWAYLRILEGKNLGRLALTVQDTPTRTRPL